MDENTEILINQVRGLHREFEAFRRRLEIFRPLISTANVSSPPTAAELDSAFGQPAALGAGFVGYIDDNGAGATYWHTAVVNGAWAYVQMAKAV